MLKLHWFGLFSPLGTLAERDIFSANVLSLFFSFFNGRHFRPGSSELNGPSLTKISGLVDGCKCLFTSLSLFDFSRTLPWQPMYFVAMPFGNGMG